VPDVRRPSELTQRQQEVLALVRRGRSNREIAKELGITEDGVKAHLSRLFLRFAVTNRVELLAAANLDPRLDGTLSAGVPLGQLRAIAGRASAEMQRMDSAPSARLIGSQLASVHSALAEVDAALGLLTELPPETTGAVVTALRKRLAHAFDSLEAAQEAIPSAHPA